MDIWSSRKQTVHKKVMRTCDDSKGLLLVKFRVIQVSANLAVARNCDLHNKVRI